MVPSPPWVSGPEADLAAALVACRQDLVVGLRRSFPAVDDGLREDAVADVWAQVAASPERYLQALARSGPEGLRALLQVACWRSLRAELRCAWRRRHAVGRAEPEGCTASPEELMVARRAERLLPGWIEQAARETRKRDPAPLVRALHERLGAATGDEVVARRHGLPRSALLHARHRVWHLAHGAPELRRRA